MTGTDTVAICFDSDADSTTKTAALMFCFIGHKLFLQSDKTAKAVTPGYFYLK
jgi:hypothetical protein